MAATSWPARFAVAGCALAGLVTGLSTLLLAQRAETSSWAGRTTSADVLLVVAGWSLIAAGLLMTRQLGRRTSGVLLVAAGFGWFVGDWNNQYAGSSMVFTAGLVFSTVGPALFGHALLRYDGRRLDGFGRAAVTIAYLSTAVVAGLAPALYFRPAGQGCAACAGNIFSLHSDPSVVGQLGRAGVFAGPIWCTLLLLAIARELLRARGRRRSLITTLLPGIAYLSTVGVMYLLAYKADYVSINPATQAIWYVQGSLLGLTAAGTLWPLVDRRLTRARVTRLVLQMATASPAGGLSSLLSGSLRDPSLRVLYTVANDDVIDPDGRPAGPGDGQVLTRLVRGEQTVALLAHRPGLLGDPNMTEEIAEVARLVLENERLQAQNRWQLYDLQESRSRIVQFGDQERRRLERDLHDGAQQQLVALSLALQLAAIRHPEAEQVARLTEARAQVSAALAELRSLARGIYPRELADEGLAAAVETLAEGSDVRVRIEKMPAGRFRPGVEATAYHIISHVAKASNGIRVRVVESDDGAQLTIEAEAADPTVDVVALTDRVGALGGRLDLDQPRRGTATIRAVLPCGS